jgi:hypothetical protein
VFASQGLHHTLAHTTNQSASSVAGGIETEFRHSVGMCVYSYRPTEEDAEDCEAAVVRNVNHGVAAKQVK